MEDKQVCEWVVDVHACKAGIQNSFAKGVHIMFTPEKALGFKISSRKRAFKSCHVALMAVQKGKNKFQIGRVEAIQLTKDGSEITSFQTKSKVLVRIRCSLYNHEGDGVYRVLDDVILTNWKTNSSIIAKIVLKPIPGQCFKYTLHPSSEDYLNKLGTVPPTAVKTDHRPL